MTNFSYYCVVRLIYRQSIVLLIVLSSAFHLKAQSWLMLDKDNYDIVDRLIIAEKDSAIHTSFKPYFFGQDDERLTTSRENKTSGSELDRLLSYELSDSLKGGLWGKIYKDEQHFSSLNTPALKLRADPVILFSGGSNNGEMLYVNTRGAVIRGVIDDKVSFYTFATDNQMRVPDYVADNITLYGGVPHENYWKTISSGGTITANSYDYFSARGAISANLTNSINLAVGYDKNFIGDGYRSMILSDFGGAYSFAKVTTKAWRIQYTNLYAKLTDEVQFSGNAPAGAGLYSSKYLALHHLSINIRDNLNLGLFESIVFARQDSLGNSLGYDLNYLNPIIFYRAIEQNVGSADNALLGLNLKYEPFSNVRLYGQFLLDEFKFSKMIKPTGWWANKFAWQLGSKYVDAFNRPGLDLFVEWNRVRPHTYAHTYSYNSYTHYQQPLAHPLGANFGEVIIGANQQIGRRIRVSAKYFAISKGLDSSDAHFGGNVLLSNRDRYRYNPNSAIDDGHFIGQGVLNRINLFELNANYSFGSGLIAELTYVSRSQKNMLTGTSLKTNIVYAGIRMNVQRRRHDF